MKKLNDKIALVTGGTSGIGKATAHDFIEQGAMVIITGRNQNTVDETVKELGGNAKGIVSDASKLSAIKELAEKIKEITPKIDVVFVNAGFGQFSPLEFIDEQHFDDMFNVNVKGLLFTIQQILPLLQNGSTIILNASVVHEIGIPNASVYSATKAAVISLGKTLAAELLPRGIRVNTISPGLTQSNFFEKTGLTHEQIEGFAAQMLQKVPAGRFASVNEIAKTVTFLASDDASYIIGEEIKVDGGMTTI